jgi:hypothetical protein
MAQEAIIHPSHLAEGSAQTIILFEPFEGFPTTMPTYYARYSFRFSRD